MAFTLNNEFLDKLRLSEHHVYLKSLRTIGAGFKNRAELSTILGISPETIRRYESNWSNSKPPQWYELILRFLCGDLSYHGDYWHHCRIHPHTCQLSTPFDNCNAYLPRDLHMKYNRIHQLNESELRKLRIELNALKIELDAAKILNSTLSQRIELLEQENTRLKDKNAAIKSGKVIELSSRR